MNDIKVGSSEMGNIYLGTNQLSKSGSTVDVNKDGFRYNYSMYCFINTTNQDKTIYIFHDAASQDVVIPANTTKVFNFENESESGISIKAKTAMTVCTFHIGYDISVYGNKNGRTSNRINQSIAANGYFSISACERGCGIFYITA